MRIIILQHAEVAVVAAAGYLSFLHGIHHHAARLMSMGAVMKFTPAQ